MVVDSQATILYSPARSAPPPGFVAAQAPAGANPAGLWRYMGIPQGLEIAHGMAVDLDYDVGGEPVTAVRVADGVTETLELLFHERFHAYQESHFQDPIPSIRWEGVSLDSARLARLDELERTVLKCALAADPLRPARVARDYVAVRVRRMSGEPDSIVQAEHRVERIEGSAQWVGMRMAARVQDHERADFQRRLSELLDWRPEPTSFGFVADGLPAARRQRLYATGAAILEIVDRLGVPAWRTRLTAGEAPFRILAEVVGIAEAVGEGLEEPLDRAIGAYACDAKGV